MFYYLQTRYYDPTICRFINADNNELLGTLSQVIGQLNLYAYANNNPIMHTDASGELVIATAIIIGAVVGAVISAGFTVASQVEKHGWDTNSWDWGEIIVSTLGGALSGAVAATPLGLGVQIGVNAGINMLQNVVSQINSGESFNVYEMLTHGAVGAFAGYVGGAGFGYVAKGVGMQIEKYLLDKTFSAFLRSTAYSILRSSLFNIIALKDA